MPRHSVIVTSPCGPPCIPGHVPCQGTCDLHHTLPPWRLWWGGACAKTAHDRAWRDLDLRRRQPVPQQRAPKYRYLPDLRARTCILARVHFQRPGLSSLCRTHPRPPHPARIHGKGNVATGFLLAERTNPDSFYIFAVSSESNRLLSASVSGVRYHTLR